MKNCFWSAICATVVGVNRRWRAFEAAAARRVKTERSRVWLGALCCTVTCVLVTGCAASPITAAEYIDRHRITLNDADHSAQLIQSGAAAQRRDGSWQAFGGECESQAKRMSTVTRKLIDGDVADPAGMQMLTRKLLVGADEYRFACQLAKEMDVSLNKSSDINRFEKELSRARRDWDENLDQLYAAAGQSFRQFGSAK